MTSNKKITGKVKSWRSMIIYLVIMLVASSVAIDVSEIIHGIFQLSPLTQEVGPHVVFTSLGPHSTSHNSQVKPL